MKILKRTLPVALASLLILNSAVPALAAETSSEAPSEKEEVIYITLDADGKLKNSYVVNSFSGGNITDYGDYASVKMLNTSESLLPGRIDGCGNPLEHFPALLPGREGILCG